MRPLSWFERWILFAGAMVLLHMALLMGMLARILISEGVWYLVGLPIVFISLFLTVMVRLLMQVWTGRVLW